jgi:hypothetical protein
VVSAVAAVASASVLGLYVALASVSAPYVALASGLYVVMMLFFAVVVQPFW